jgi:hypothetical protein
MVFINCFVVHFQGDITEQELESLYTLDIALKDKKKDAEVKNNPKKKKNQYKYEKIKPKDCQITLRTFITIKRDGMNKSFSV